MLILEATPSLNIIFWRVVRSAEINFPYFTVFYVSFALFLFALLHKLHIYFTL